jgi:hypothetical protein
MHVLADHRVFIIYFQQLKCRLVDKTAIPVIVKSVNAFGGGVEQKPDFLFFFLKKLLLFF